MNDEQNWDEQTYIQVFHDICAYIENRKQNDQTFTLSDLKKMIDDAYQRRGMDWIGKGPLQFIIETATIAALEHKYVEWTKQQKT